MKKLTAEDAETRSPDVVAENVEQLKTIFPEAFTEEKVDFEVLKQLLGGMVEEREEKYGLNWHGKRRARQLALTPSTGTLRPCPEESVDWDTTRNLMIEGDNLEVLKLLQKSYSGKVKLIYIDPPYNTGKDFVYPDDFRDNIKNYLELTGQVNGEGNKISSNTEASGRFHTDWLNMMYPRLRLARNLLQEDGLIFISIDDNEVINLRAACNEVFGEENFIEGFVWKKSYGGGAKERFAVRQHEFCLLYAKNIEAIDELWLPPDPDAEEKYYDGKDENLATRGPFRIKPLEATKSMDRRENLVYGIPAPDGTEVFPKRQWWWSKDRALKTLGQNGLVFNKTSDGWSVSYKQYLIGEDGLKRGAKPFSVIDGIYTQQGTANLRELFDDEVVLQFPKPVALLERLLNVAGDKDALVLDFFAGSGTTAQAVLELNREDHGRRRFILVQLPERTERKDFRTIAEITKERIRRVVKKLNELDSGQLDLNQSERQDLGFRVFKLASSNIRAWEPNRDDLPTTLHDSIEHLKTDRTEQDILFELLLKLGLDLTIPIEQKSIAGKAVHNIGAGTLLVCLAEKIATAEVEPLALGIVAWHKALAPAGETTVVFRDSAFADDVAKTNLTAILQQHGLDNVRSL
jgi:adenine-specific DNA-methyltransferase